MPTLEPVTGTLELVMSTLECVMFSLELVTDTLEGVTGTLQVLMLAFKGSMRRFFYPVQPREVQTSVARSKKEENG